MNLFLFYQCSVVYWGRKEPRTAVNDDYGS